MATKKKIEVEMIDIDMINQDQSTQVRASHNEDAQKDYTDSLIHGGTLPAIDLFYDRENGTYFIGDGWHRFWSWQDQGREDVPARVHAGGERKAWLFALGANTDHGARRTNADKRSIVEAALSDAELTKWSDRKIAEHCKVSKTFVLKVRADVSPTDDLSGGLRDHRSGQLAASNHVRSFFRRRAKLDLRGAVNDLSGRAILWDSAGLRRHGGKVGLYRRATFPACNRSSLCANRRQSRLHAEGIAS